MLGDRDTCMPKPQTWKQPPDRHSSSAHIAVTDMSSDNHDPDPDQQQPQQPQQSQQQRASTSMAAFTPTLPSITMKSTSPSPTAHHHNTCPSCKGEKKTSTRRTFIKTCLFAASALLGSQRTSAAEVVNDKPCTNCLGSGEVTCELCLGSGFWRALSNNDPKQKYKGVVCPECEGSGNLICPVCLGTGEGNVKGLLRRRQVKPGPGRILQS